MNYGFIGLGNMAGAIIRGMFKNGFFDENNVYGHNRSPEKTAVLSEETGLIPCATNREVAEAADVVILAVKPQMMDGVLAEIPKEVFSGKLVITIAAGKTLEWYETRLPGTAVIRCMPNINSIVGCSSTAVCGGSLATSSDIETAKTLFASVGSVYVITENLFAGFSSLCGASVAFTFMYIEALACAGVKSGFAKPVALQMATESVLGCAKLLTSGAGSPMEMVDKICSPGGTTIEGVHKLRELAFENAVYKAIDAVIAKDKLIG